MTQETPRCDGVQPGKSQEGSSESYDWDITGTKSKKRRFPLSSPFLYWLVVWNINFIFPYIGNNHPNWLIFFRGVQTTNQYRWYVYHSQSLVVYGIVLPTWLGRKLGCQPSQPPWRGLTYLEILPTKKWSNFRIHLYYICMHIYILLLLFHVYIMYIFCK